MNGSVTLKVKAIKEGHADSPTVERRIRVVDGGLKLTIELDHREEPPSLKLTFLTKENKTYTIRTYDELLGWSDLRTAIPGNGEPYSEVINERSLDVRLFEVVEDDLVGE